MKGLIAAGGKGSRLRPITTTQNKHAIPLANKSMIQHAVEKLASAGIIDIIISINEGDTTFQDLLGTGERFGVKLTYLEQKGGALGVAHVLKNAKEELQGEDVVFYLGDNIILSDIQEYKDRFYQDKLDCLLALSRVKDPQRFGVPVIDGDRIVEIQEKPEVPMSPYAVTGIYFYTPKIFEVLEQLPPSDRGEYEISDAHTALIKAGGEVGYAEITGWWKDTGKPADLLEGNALILGQLTSKIEGDIEDSVGIQGVVVIEPGAKVIGQSFLRGPLIIGQNSIIENAYVGPYTSIGKDSHIKDGEVEHSLIMDNVSIDASSRIVDAIIGHNATITSKEHTFPRGHQLVVGDNSYIEL